MTDMVSAEIHKGPRVVDVDGLQSDVVGQESISADEIKTLLQEVETGQVQGASDVLERVAADGGIEAHSMKGDPSKCPFLMGKLGVMQHVEIGEVQVAPEGRSVKEIREERRRMRAQVKESQSEPEATSVVQRVDNDIKDSDHNVLGARPEQAILEMQAVSTSIERDPDERLAPAEILVPQLLSAKEAAEKGGKTKDHGLSESNAPSLPELKPLADHVNDKPVHPLIPESSIDIERINETPSAQRTLPVEQGFVESPGEVIYHRVDALQDTDDLVVVAPEASRNMVPDEESAVEVASQIDQNMPLIAEAPAGLISESLAPENQEPQEVLTSLQEVVLPYVDSAPQEKQVIMDAVLELHEKIAEMIDRAEEQAAAMAEIAPIMESLARNLPEKLRAEFIDILELKVREMILQVENVRDQREPFNLLGTHEFKFFHHKPQSQLPIKEKASRYLLALLSKRYASA